MEPDDEELGEDQALLILYLSGELPEDQHAALERRLASDDALRKELEGLRAAQAMIWREMLAADSAHPLRGVASSAHRKLAGMVRQWAVQKLAKEPAPVSRSHSIRRWGIALAAAAVIAIGSAMYLYLPDDETDERIAQVMDETAVDPTDEAAPMDDVLVSIGLYEVEQEIDELFQLRAMSEQ